MTYEMQEALGVLALMGMFCICVIYIVRQERSDDARLWRRGMKRYVDDGNTVQIFDDSGGRPHVMSTDCWCEPVIEVVQDYESDTVVSRLARHHDKARTPGLKQYAGVFDECRRDGPYSHEDCPRWVEGLQGMVYCTCGCHGRKQP